MNIKIKETGEIKTLSIIDRRSVVNWVADLIGNSGALSDGQFVWDEDEDAYLADMETYDWWDKYISDYETTEAEIDALAEELDIDREIVNERVSAAMSEDYGNHRSQAVRAMTELREEHSDE